MLVSDLFDTGLVYDVLSMLSPITAAPSTAQKIHATAQMYALSRLVSCSSTEISMAPKCILVSLFTFDSVLRVMVGRLVLVSLFTFDFMV